MKISGLLVLLIILSFLLFSCRKDTEKKDALIIRFIPEKCGCCWGWVIKIGNDTIKADKFPGTFDPGYDFTTPVLIKIEVGNKTQNCYQKGSNYFYDYYEIGYIEKVE